MEFGRVFEPLEDIDFSLPAETEGTIQTLETAKDDGEFKVYVGAARWAERRWLGDVYPRKTSNQDFITVYAANFNTVEFGASFYDAHEPEYIKIWADKVSESADFRFYPKFPQTITHIRRLTNVESATEQFYRSLEGFGTHVGPLLMQFGENFSPKSFPQLKAYLAQLPKTHKVSIEVRNKDWFAIQHHRWELFELLNRLDMIWVIPDTAGRRDCVHMELTTPNAIIRFVGNSPDKSDYLRLDAWVDRLASWKNRGLQSIWFYIHQHEEVYTPKMCDYFIEQVNLKLGVNVKRPTLIS